jgi:hypothetical protein
MAAAVDYSIAERIDGHKGTSTSDAGRKRRSHATPLNLSDLDYFIAHGTYAPMWGFAEEIAGELEVRIGPGLLITTQCGQFLRPKSRKHGLITPYDAWKKHL